jgi:hypothetical protein
MKTILCTTVENEGKFSDDHSDWEVDSRVERDGTVWLNSRYSDAARLVVFDLKSWPIELYLALSDQGVTRAISARVYLWCVLVRCATRSARASYCQSRSFSSGFVASSAASIESTTWSIGRLAARQACTDCHRNNSQCPTFQEHGLQQDFPIPIPAEFSRCHAHRILPAVLSRCSNNRT